MIAPLQCPACGSPLTPGFGACSRCGRPVDLASPPPATAAAPATQSPPTTNTAPPDPPEAVSAGWGRGRRQWLLGGAAVALVAAAAAVVVLLNTGGSGSGGTSPLDQRAKDARDVAAALSTLVTDPASLRADGQSLADVDARAAVPDGAKVTADPASWQPDGAGGGVIRVSLTTADGITTTYLAVVVHEDAGWKVQETFPATAATPAASAPPTAVAS